MKLVVRDRNVLVEGGRKMMGASCVIEDGPATALACSCEESTPSMATKGEKIDGIRDTD